MTNETKDFIEVDYTSAPPSAERVQELLSVIAPGSRVAAVLPLAGSYSNSTHLAEIDSASGQRSSIVIRRYAPCSYGRSAKARLEFQTLAWLQNHDVPAPAPLYLDEQGAILGTPAIVTSFMPGAQIMAPPDPVSWARAAAKMLAKIHAVPGKDAQDFLLEANAEATWFLRYEDPPAYMLTDPDGLLVWQTIRARGPHIQPVAPALVHLDYWRGNLLWEGGVITAVVDWEEAAYGDPAIDVAYCFMELVIMGMMTAAETFLAVYEAQCGQQIANLDYWKLAAAARPMTDISGWLTEPAKEARFRHFIAEAYRRLCSTTGQVGSYK